MSDRMLKVKACEHTSRTLVFSSGEDAPGKSLDTCEQCNTCGAVIHDYRHNGGQRSPNYPIVRQSPLLEPFLSVCQQLIEAERTLNARGMSCTPDLDMIRLAKENERLRLDLPWFDTCQTIDCQAWPTWRVVDAAGRVVRGSYNCDEHRPQEQPLVDGERYEHRQPLRPLAKETP